MITLTAALTALSRMMGKRTLPQGDNSDWEDYTQTAFDYAWRYYEWDWSLRVATIDLVSDPYMPADFDLMGYREVISEPGDNFTEVTLKDYFRLPTGLQNFALQYDATLNRYEVLTNSGATSLQIIYQVVPPTLSTQDESNEYVPVPFPSAQTIGIGASIYAKQGENPQTADVSQEWDMFHAELDRHVGRAYRSEPKNLNQNLQDAYGTYTGDTRV